MPEQLRIALITDIHYGPDDLTKRGSEGLDLLAQVLDEITAWQPDLLIDLGDRITDTTSVTDRAYLEQVSRMFHDLTLPRVHLLGNHDVAHLSRHQSEAVLQSPLHSRSTEIKGWHLTFWYPDVRYQPGLGRFTLTDNDLAWLNDDLNNHWC